MIFYFSGTGNSAWVARQLAEGQNEGQRNNLRDFIFKHII